MQKILANLCTLLLLISCTPLSYQAAAGESAYSPSSLLPLAGKTKLPCSNSLASTAKKKVITTLALLPPIAQDPELPNPDCTEDSQDQEAEIGLTLLPPIAQDSQIPDSNFESSHLAVAGNDQTSIKLLLPQDATAVSPPTYSSSPEDYVLGPGDTIAVVDYSSGTSTPLLREMPILPDGKVRIHPVGTVKASGFTITQFNELVNQKASKFLIAPQIDISVSRIRPAVVYILGDVANPGMYTTASSSSEDSSFQATPTIISALQRAGGLKDSADVRKIRITRLNSSEPILVNLWQMLVEGDTKQDISLQAGDTIFVPHGGSDYDPNSLGLVANRKRVIRIWGAVPRPGLYELKPEDDMLSAIALAGGFTHTAVTRHVLLSRLNHDGSLTTQKVSMSQSIRKLNSLGRSHLNSGDVIIVADSTVKRASAFLGKAAFTMGAAITLLLLAYNLPNRSNAGQSNSSSSSSSNQSTLFRFPP